MGAVFIVLLTSVLFGAYDFFVRLEVSENKELLESKRRFVRYVSHEVRTPLNSVCMGLELVQEEIARSLGYRGADEMRRHEAITEMQKNSPNSSRFEESSNLCCVEDMEDLEGDEDSESRDGGYSSEGVRHSGSALPADKQELAREVFSQTQDIVASAQSSVNVLNDLLNYDKIEMGTLRLELTVLSMWRVAESTAAEFRLPAVRKNISMDFFYQEEVNEPPRDDPEDVASRYTQSRFLPRSVRCRKCVGDEVRLKQVLRNLISNAIKFTCEGGRIIVRVTWTPAQDSETIKAFVLNDGSHVEMASAGSLWIHVSDTGVGMSPEQLSRLFSAGMQFNANALQSGQGSGLGLYISKGIVEQHKGQLTAASKGIGSGTTFTMLIPLYRNDDHKESSLLMVDPSARSTDGNLNQMSDQPLNTKFRILVVDDTISNRKLLVKMLERLGHECDCAENGIEAVTKVAASLKNGSLYDTVLLDYEMPVMNGPQAASEIRQLLGADMQSLLIFGITGNVLSDDVAYFKKCGVNDVIAKPFKMKVLDELWKRHLQRR